MPTYLLEYAKSGRSGCKGTCKGKIEKGHIRLGASTEADGFERTYWRHFPECATAKVAHNIVEALGSVDNVTGFQDLKSEDQRKVKAEFAELLGGKEGAASPAKAKKSSAAKTEDEDEPTTKGKGSAKKRAKASDDGDDKKEKAKAAKGSKKPAAKKAKPVEDDDDE